MSAGITCRKCLGRIDEAAFAFRRRVSEKLGRPYSPPMLCSECALLAMLRLAIEDDDGDGDIRNEIAADGRLIATARKGGRDG